MTSKAASTVQVPHLQHQKRPQFVAVIPAAGLMLGPEGPQGVLPEIAALQRLQEDLSVLHAAGRILNAFLAKYPGHPRKRHLSGRSGQRRFQPLFRIDRFRCPDRGRLHGLEK